MPGRVSVTIDGIDKKFNAIQAVITICTQKDAAGMPVLQTLSTKAHVWIDLNDDTNFPFTNIQTMFTLANVPDRSKLKEMKLEFWKDDTMQDVICAYDFKGWISKFEVYNPVLQLTEHPALTDAANRVYNHVLHMELEPVINKENHCPHSIAFSGRPMDFRE